MNSFVKVRDPPYLHYSLFTGYFSLQHALESIVSFTEMHKTPARGRIQVQLVYRSRTPCHLSMVNAVSPFKEALGISPSYHRSNFPVSLHSQGFVFSVKRHLQYRDEYLAHHLAVTIPLGELLAF